MNLKGYRYERTSGHVVIGRLVALGKPTLFVVRQNRGLFVTDANGLIMQPWRQDNHVSLNPTVGQAMGSCGN